MYLLKDAPGLRKLLINNPCIAVENNKLIAIAFINGSEELKEDAINRYARYLWPGLDRLVLYCFDDIEDATYETLGKCSIFIRSAKKLLNNYK